jgi:hypothetical protein
LAAAAGSRSSSGSGDPHGSSEIKEESRNTGTQEKKTGEKKGTVER